jgi:tetratricopeptide (TPR) repeat protein
MLKPGRNDACPCGSGRKYKRCCGIGPATERVRAGRAGLAAPTPIERNQLIAMLNGGEYALAETTARAMIDRFPTYGLAWKVLGLAQLSQGKDAVDALRGAATFAPQDAEIHANLGNALHNLGRLEEAVASCRRALTIDPNGVEALNNLGNALANLGRYGEAVECYSRALALQPRYAAAHCNLGNAQRSLGRLAESVASCRRAIALSPGLADAHGNLGTALRDLGEWDAAAASYRQALALQPRHAAVFDSLGELLRDMGRSEEAAGCHWQALQLKPKYASAYRNLGLALTDLGRIEEAAESFSRALALQPQDAATLAGLAAALRLLGQPAEAEACCRKALALHPRFAAVEALLGELHADQGRFAAASAAFRRALELDPNSVEAWIGLAQGRSAGAGVDAGADTSADTAAELRAATGSDTGAAWLTEAQRLLAGRLPLRLEVALRFAVAAEFDAAGAYEAAFTEFQVANERSRAARGAYDRSRARADVDALIESFDAAWFSAVAAAANDSERPVFILGMPRSGATLVAQILGAHPAAGSAGNSRYWQAAAGALRAARAKGESGVDLLAAMAGEYLRLADARAPGAKRVIDRSPTHVRNLAAIHAALPRARFVHVVRAPLDNLWSLYTHHLGPAHPYTSDFEDLVHELRETERLWAHWRLVLPAGSLFEVPYEALIADPDQWTRRLVEFAGLPWDPPCLDHRAAPGAVLTPSKWQVRRPLSNASLGRAARYTAQLAPLRSLLERSGG